MVDSISIASQKRERKRETVEEQGILQKVGSRKLRMDGKQSCYGVRERR